MTPRTHRLVVWLLATAASAQSAMPAAVQPAERPAATPGEQRCLDEFRAETTRIERDLARRVPPQQDQAAQQAWAADMHNALRQAGDRAEACSRAARAPGSSAQARAEADCAIRAPQSSDLLARRYGSRTLSAAEQTAQRQEEQRVLAERADCLQARRRR